MIGILNVEKLINVCVWGGGMLFLKILLRWLGGEGFHKIIPLLYRGGGS